MKIVSILGSPHISGNGSKALEYLACGMDTEYNEYIKFDLCKMSIRNCLGCRKCIENGGNCIINDDFAEIFEQIKTADLVIIESPIYINQVNGYIKTLLDRCYPLADKNHKPRFGKRKLVMLWTYGVPIPFIFNRYIRYTSGSLKAMGLMIHKNIIVNGCTTIDKMEKDMKWKEKLYKLGKKFTSR